MKNNEEKLQFIVKFSQEDFAQFKDWQFLKLREDLFNFLDIPKAGPLDLKKGPVRFAAIPNEALSVIDAATIEPVRKSVYDILKKFAGLESSVLLTVGDESANKFFAGRRFSAADIKIEEPIDLSVVSMSQDLTSMLSLRASLKTCVLLKFSFLLTAEPTSEIHKCKSEKCKNLFYRVRRQEFCSKACSNRDHMAKTRAAATADKAAESEKNHKNYKNRIGKKLGAVVATKVRRRSKTKKG